MYTFLVPFSVKDKKQSSRSIPTTPPFPENNGLISYYTIAVKLRVYYSTVVSFYRIRARERAKYVSDLPCTNPRLTGFLLKEEEAKKKCTGIIYLLCGARKNTIQLIKYPRVLFTKTPNKVCVLSFIWLGQRLKIWSNFHVVPLQVLAKVLTILN